MTAITSGLLGVNITDTPTTNTSQHALGTCVTGVDGTEFVYVLAGGAITQYDAVGIDEDFSATALTKAAADDGHNIGFAQVAFTSGDYGWVAKKGTNISVRLAASCAADVPLYTTATAGVLDDASTSQTKIDGVVAVAAVVTAGESEVVATYPKSTTF
jgi:hypothetical protein